MRSNVLTIAVSSAIRASEVVLISLRAAISEAMRLFSASIAARCSTVARTIALSVSTSSGSSATVGIIADTRTRSPPIFEAFQMPRFKMSQPLSNQPIADAAPLSVEPFSSPSRRQGQATEHSSAAQLPARSAATKLLLLERFRKQANTAAIPPNDLHPVGSFRAEDVERSVEGINTAVAHQGHQRHRSFAEVDRHAGNINFNARRDHALRTARMTLAR